MRFLTLFFFLLTAVAVSAQTIRVPVVTESGVSYQDLHIESIGPYAVIRIDLPAGYYDFELKASANNFSGVEGEEIIWFYHSADPEKIAIPEQVWTNRPDVYFTDSGWWDEPLHNARHWRLQSPTQSLYAMRADNQSRYGSIIVIIRDDLSEYRDQLTWSYILFTPSGVESDPAGRGIWRQAFPIRWVHTFSPNP